MKSSIHYNNKRIKNELLLKDITVDKYDILKSAQGAREKLDGHNLHSFISIPSEYKEGLTYHSECYKKYTFAQTLFENKEKLEGNENDAGPSQTRRSAGVDDIGLFPEHCICKKIRLVTSVKGKKSFEYQPNQIVTKTAENRLKLAAEIKWSNAYCSKWSRPYCKTILEAFKMLQYLYESSFKRIAMWVKKQ